MIDLAIESLSQRLGWPDVSERHPADLGVRVFEVHPRVAALPAIVVCFNPALTEISQVALSSWHTHYDGLAQGVRGLALAMRDIKRLIRQQACVVECIAEDKRPLGASLVGMGQLPTTVSLDTHLLRRVVFDRIPTEEPLDLSQYVPGRFFLERKDHGGRGGAA
jgi:hypothetical protein